MSHASENPVGCAQADQGCTAQVPGSRWAQIKAQAEGWFFSREAGEAFCPDHNPPWVAGWRARRDQR